MDQLAEDENEKRQADCWINLCIFSLLVAGLGLVCLFAFALKASMQSQDVTATVDTIPSLYVAKTSTHPVTPPLHAKNTSVTTTPEDRHNVPSSRPVTNECSTCPCRSLAQQIREKLDYSIDPCNDFYKFVCNTFRGKNEFIHARESIRLFTLLRLVVPYIPESNQLSVAESSRACTMPCLNFVASYKPETEYLVEWMVSLNLDFLNDVRLATVNPFEIMVRGSLDLGIEVVISIIFDKKKFLHSKRLMQLDYSNEQRIWRARKRSEQDYVNYLTMYGLRPAHGMLLASNLREYERRHQWGTFISKYTNGTYLASDYIHYRPQVNEILVRLFEDESVGRQGLRYLVAWIIYRQLVEFTEPYLFTHGRTASDACYEHVRKVMDLAVLSPYFQSEIQPYMVEQVKLMASKIRGAFLKALESSSWLSGNIREGAIRKLKNMTAHVGSPGRRLDPAFVEEFYKPFPDAPLDILFPTWIRAHALSSHYIWMDQTNQLYNDAQFSPHYNDHHNDFTIATANLFSPFMYPYGPIALNYGGLGMMVAHEIMHAFDVQGIGWLLQRYASPNKGDILSEYTKRALCLRKSHKSVLSLTAMQEELDAALDDENLADFVGTKIAYDAFASLVPASRDETLAGLDMTADQLFFFNSCAKVCAQYAVPGKALRTLSLALHSAHDEHAGILPCLRLCARDSYESTEQVQLLVEKM
ncbi:hypothetical protein MTO96_007753 [Rhipicephalus appendiculatus]